MTNGMRLVWIWLGAFSLGCGLFEDDKEDSEDANEEEKNEDEDGASLDPSPEATKALQSGDLDGARDAFEDTRDDDPISGATGLAYIKLMEDDFQGALEILREAEAEASDEELQELELRQALVLVRAGKWRDRPSCNKPPCEEGPILGAATLAEQSGLPQGLFLAGEYHLADGERKVAMGLFEDAVADESDHLDDVTKSMAEQYLELLEGPAVLKDFAEAAARWSVGMSSPGTTTFFKEQSVKDFMKLAESEGLRDTPFGSSEQLLIWSGRAASIGDVEAAQTMLDWVGGLDKDQEWRRLATQGIIYCVDGKSERCTKAFQQLKDASAPADGYRDAAATAAYHIVDSSPMTAEGLLKGFEDSNSGARALACRPGRDAGASGVLGKHLNDSDQWGNGCFTSK